MSNRALHEALDEGVGLDARPGDLVPHAVIGAVAVEYSCELVTLDP